MRQNFGQTEEQRRRDCHCEEPFDFAALRSGQAPATKQSLIRAQAEPGHERGQTVSLLPFLPPRLAPALWTTRNNTLTLCHAVGALSHSPYELRSFCILV
jgi:hypothetical protein